MKIKDGFVMREVLGRKIVAVSGEASKSFNGMIKLNETAADIWQWVSEGCSRDEIVQHLMENYNVEREVALHDVNAVCDKMIENGIWES